MSISPDSITPASADPVCLGVITTAHGLKGWVKVKSYTTDPVAIASYGPLTSANGKSYMLHPRGEAKGQLIVEIPGIRDRNAAEALRGTELFVERSLLPVAEDDEFLIQDLIGMAVRLEDETPYGHIKAFYDFGAGDIVEITTLDGKDELYTFSEANFPDIRPEDACVLFAPPEILPVGDERRDG